MKKLGRRTFLGSAATVLGTSLVEGCESKLPRSMVPYVTPPDDAVPGLARWYRTTCRACPAACGMTARVREGRAVQLEGNPEHPLSRGGLCPVGQASIESLYGPGRLASPWAHGKPIGWPEAEKTLADGLRAALDAGKSVAVLTRPEPGLLDDFLVRWLGALGQPATHRVVFAGTARPWLAAGQRRALGSEALPVPVLAAARLILSIGDDFVEEWTPVESARGLAEQRAAGGRSLYVGPRISLTAASSDSWIPVEPGSELVLVLGLCREVLRTAAPPELAPALRTALVERLAPFDPATVGTRTGLSPDRVSVLARVLTASRPGLVLGPGRVLAGTQADRLAEAVMVLNGLLGAFGNTLRFLAPPERPAGWDLEELARRARAGEIGALVFQEVDPLGSGAGHRELAEALGQVPFTAALAVELDDTARRATLVLPDHHFLESWGDASPRPGVIGVQQPVMTPVLDTRAAADILLGAARALGKTSGLPDGTWADVVRGVYDVKDREHGVKLSEASAAPVALSGSALSDLPVTPPPRRGPAGGLVLAAAPSIRELDGRVPRSALLQEIPDPLSGYAWTGWIELHPSTAAELGVHEGDVVALGGARGEVALPAHVTSAVHPGVAAVPAAQAAALLDAEALPGLELRVSARRTGERQPTHLAAGGSEQHGRELARSVSHQLPVLPPARPLPQMYAPVEHPEHRWGMTVDLDRCTGCGACTAACYVENNLPVVGAEDVRRGRSMSWIRIHAYVEPGPEGVQASLLPLSCQHCTNAPCEVVCPTFATYHTREGINAQIYPRCIGTRYCENNCPYGVRRFNFFDWPRHGLARLGLNPDVSVRERGVSEKCTLCVQRVTAGQEQAKMENRKVRDGEIVSACAASCPTRAITFGDLRDPTSQAARLAADGRAYRLLEELNTQPGVVFLARRREKA
jgi:anaerobic selenocysteine-containing dehydrogenase/Fe-S-cluster-containing dehydrogenase component